MATTPMLGLTKPAYTDPADIAVLAANAQRIDDALSGAYTPADPFKFMSLIAGVLGSGGAQGNGGPVGANKLPNSSARFGMLGWTDVSGGLIGPFGAADWNQISIVGGWYLATSGNVAANARSGYIESHTIPSGANQNWTASGTLDASSLTSTGSAMLEVHAWNGATDLGAVGTSASVAAGTTWTRVAFSFTTPANTTALTVRIWIAGGASGTTYTKAAANWSRLKLEPGSLATPYTDEADLWITGLWGSQTASPVVAIGQSLPIKVQYGTTTVDVVTVGTLATAAVAFATAFSSTPIIIPVIMSPSGQVDYWGWASSASGAGFTANVQTATGAVTGNYTFSWLAIGN